MNSQRAEALKNRVSLDDLADYLTADHGSYLGIYPDGDVSVGNDVGMEIDPKERPVVRVRCPGLGNLDDTWWTQGLVRQENGTWATTDGEAIGDLTEVIYWTCHNGDVSEPWADLMEKIEDALEESEGDSERN